MASQRVILASASKWRKEILKKAGIAFSIEESGYEEDMTVSLPPEKMVETFAEAKARLVAQRHPNAVVVGADTVLVRGGAILGKPKTKKEAAAMLSAWSGKSGRALTGLCVVKGKKKIVRVVETKLRFRKLSAKEIASYVASGEPMTGAGAFTIMNRGASLVERIEGDFYNVAGLPLSTLVPLLSTFGVK